MNDTTRLQALRNSVGVIGRGSEAELASALSSSGVAESLLGEPLVLPAIQSWWCGEESAWRTLRPRLAEFIVVPTFGCNLACTYCYQELFDPVADAVGQRLDDAEGQGARAARGGGISQHEFSGQTLGMVFLTGRQSDPRMTSVVRQLTSDHKRHAAL